MPRSCSQIWSRLSLTMPCGKRCTPRSGAARARSPAALLPGQQLQHSPRRQLRQSRGSGSWRSRSRRCSMCSASALPSGASAPSQRPARRCGRSLARIGSGPRPGSAAPVPGPRRPGPCARGSCSCWRRGAWSAARPRTSSTPSWAAASASVASGAAPGTRSCGAALRAASTSCRLPPCARSRTWMASPAASSCARPSRRSPRGTTRRRR
mmetsp:Transcript_62722/g.178121  ORF Transcript_62722/g.178121 Transcript_62722/m.178121 type:complete len:210 (+) Transcript_62722:153-782(+)